MANRKQVHTTYNKSSKQWRNKTAGKQKAASLHRTKAAAVKAGRQMAINKGAEHKIHKMNNQISESNSYGNDPREIKG